MSIDNYKKDIRKYKELIQQYESDNKDWERSQQNIKIENDGMKITVKGTNRGIISTGTTRINGGNKPHDPAKFEYLYSMIDDRKDKIKKLEESSE